MNKIKNILIFLFLCTSISNASPQDEADRILDREQKKIEQERQKEEQEKRMRLEKEIEEQAPAVAFANSLTVSKDCILVRELSKILKQNGIDVGETRLFEWLRQNGYLISKVGSDWNLPTQKSMNLGLFVIKEGTRMSTTEGSKITKTPKVTGKGQQYFLNKFLKNNRLMEVN